MPLYEYECQACGERFELIRKFSDPPVDACTKCGKGPVTRLLSSPAIQFKGSGWYITDYARAAKPGGAAAGSSNGDGAAAGEKKDDGKSEAKGAKSETKTESKSESKSESKTDSKPAPTSTS